MTRNKLECADENSHENEIRENLENKRTIETESSSIVQILIIKWHDSVIFTVSSLPWAANRLKIERMCFKWLDWSLWKSFRLMRPNTCYTHTHTLFLWFRIHSSHSQSIDQVCCLHTNELFMERTMMRNRWRFQQTHEKNSWLHVFKVNFVFSVQSFFRYSFVLRL